MKDYVKRMIEEQKKLSERISKAKAALDSDKLNDEQKSLLKKQIEGMESYNKSLVCRIDYETNRKVFENNINKGEEVISKMVKMNYNQLVELDKCADHILEIDRCKCNKCKDIEWAKKVAMQEDASLKDVITAIGVVVGKIDEKLRK